TGSSLDQPELKFAFAPPQTKTMKLAETKEGLTDGERKKHAADVGRELGERLGTGSVGNAATAAALGDTFQYMIDHPVTLPRQKSAMLPIVGKDIEGTR